MRSTDIPSSASMHGIAGLCPGGATEQVRDNMPSEKTLEHIVNFFSPSAASLGNAGDYEAFAQAMTTALVTQENSDTNPYKIPERLVVDFLSYNVVLVQQGKLHNTFGPVTIEISKNGETISEDIKMALFHRTTTTLLLRHKAGLPPNFVDSTDNNFMNLQGANFYETNLIGLELSEANLSKANLEKANLQLTSLEKTNLKEANLKGAYMKGVNLAGANLEGADLKGADLTRAYMPNAILNGANLSEVRLSFAEQSETVMIKANLSRSDLSNSYLTGSNLTGADLSEANLSNTILYHAELIGADLTGANLSGVRLEGANLDGADLTGANLNNAHLFNTKLKGANLSNIKQGGTLLSLPTWNIDTLDRDLNHFNNPIQGSLLTMIDSIDEQYADVKLRMVRELMSSLQISGVDLSTVAFPLMDTLSKVPYTGDIEINTWLNTLWDQYLSRYSRHALPEHEGMWAKSVDFFTRQPEKMLSYNGAFVQVIAHGMTEKKIPEMAVENKTPEMERKIAALEEKTAVLKEKTAALYDIYLNLERIKPYCETEFFGDYQQKPDWKDEGAINAILIPAEVQQPEVVSAMLLSQHSLVSMLQPKPDTVWNNFYLYRDPNYCLTDEERPQLRTLFGSQFPIFNDPYIFMSNRAKFYKLIKTLNLGELEASFISAIETNHSKTKLNSLESQAKLNAIFATKLTNLTEDEQYPNLTDVHYGEIINAYKLASASDTDKAKMLLCLAALFTRYSSSTIFGTEDDSPYALRCYAYALMNKAHTLDEDLIDNVTFTNWANRLLGLNGAFSCSAVVSKLMVEDIKKKFPKVLSGIMPPAWS